MARKTTKTPLKVPVYSCPNCGGKRARDIVYGYFPDLGKYKLSKKDMFFLGGCCIEPEDRACPDCRFKWDSKTGQNTISLSLACAEKVVDAPGGWE